MTPATASIEELLGLAIRHVDAGHVERARTLCEQALSAATPLPAVHQLLAVIDLQQGDADAAAQWAMASLALRPGHPPTVRVAADVSSP